MWALLRLETAIFVSAVLGGWPPQQPGRSQASNKKELRSGGHTLDLRHVVVNDGGRVAVVPIYRDAAPRRAFDRALIFRVAPPGNSVSCPELSRFFTGHCVLVFTFVELGSVHPFTGTKNRRRG
jgi:hypothetical protein